MFGIARRTPVPRLISLSTFWYALLNFSRSISSSCKVAWKGKLRSPCVSGPILHNAAVLFFWGIIFRVLAEPSRVHDDDVNPIFVAIFNNFVTFFNVVVFRRVLGSSGWAERLHCFHEWVASFEPLVRGGLYALYIQKPYIDQHHSIYRY